MRMKEFMANCYAMVVKDGFSKNIAQYMESALEKGNAIYFYAIVSLEKYKDIDKMTWIKDIKHEEYDNISIQWSNGRRVYYKSKLSIDKVIKLDLIDRDVRRVFDENFKIGTNSARKVVEANPLFDKAAGYELRNFIITNDDEVIMDAILHGGFNITISKEIVNEVDKKCKKEKIIKWIKTIIPFVNTSLRVLLCRICVLYGHNLQFKSVHILSGAF